MNAWNIIRNHLLALLVLRGVAALGQVQEQVAPTELKQKTIVTEPQTLYKGFLRTTLAFNHGTFDKIFTASGKKESLASNIWGSSWATYLYITYGVSDRLQVEVMVPYLNDAIYQSYRIEAPDLEIVGVQKWKVKGSGLGDLTLSAAYQIIPETEAHPSFSIFMNGRIPTGEKNPKNVNPDNPQEYDKPVGSGEAAVDATFRMRKVRYPFSYSFFGTYQHFFGGNKLLDPQDTEEKPFQSGANISVGGYFFFHLNDWIAIRTSGDYFYSIRDEYDGVKEEDDSWALQFYPGLSFQIKRFRIDQAVNVPLAGKLISADPSYFLILGYTF